MNRRFLVSVICFTLLISNLALAGCAAPPTAAPVAPAATSAPAAPAAPAPTAAPAAPTSAPAAPTSVPAPTAAPAATVAPTKAPVASVAAPTVAPTAWAVKPGTLRLATTTSTADTGLLAWLLPNYEKTHNIKIDVVAVGTGQAIAIGQKGDADVLLVHARAQEDKFVADKDAKERFDVMYNDFILVGPKDDPAKVLAAKDASSALTAIATAQATFVSRGDKSGTNTKELSLWSTAKITPTKELKWYNAIGQGMGDTLLFADEQKGYTMTDRGTWLAMQPKMKNLVIVLGGNTLADNKDKSLLNPYGIMAVSPDKHPGVQYTQAMDFVNWFKSAETMKLIGTFGVDKYGQQLFYPDSAEYKAK
jgi:tungstate transport system substrate-binding protein